MPAKINFNFLGGAETQKNCLVNFFSNFNNIFLATWGCASDFLKMLPKFKMAAMGAKTPKLRKLFKFYYHIPNDIEMFILLKFKMAAMDKLHIFSWAQKLKN